MVPATNSGLLAAGDRFRDGAGPEAPGGEAAADEALEDMPSTGTGTGIGTTTMAVEAVTSAALGSEIVPSGLYGRRANDASCCGAEPLAELRKGATQGGKPSVAFRHRHGSHEAGREELAPLRAPQLQRTRLLP